jgi:hypothetical protein
MDKKSKHLLPMGNFKFINRSSENVKVTENAGEREVDGG